MQLERYDTARTALAECSRVDEVKDIRDKAAAMAAYARQARDPDLIQWATEIKVRAERKAGEMLRDSAGRAERQTGGNPQLSSSTTVAPSLTDIGITRDQSSRWQRLAAMPEEHFESAVESAKSAASEVTTAFLLREAARAQAPAAPQPGERTSPPPKPQQGNDVALLRQRLAEWEQWFREVCAVLSVSSRGAVLYRCRTLVGRGYQDDPARDGD